MTWEDILWERRGSAKRAVATVLKNMASTTSENETKEGEVLL